MDSPGSPNRVSVSGVIESLRGCTTTLSGVRIPKEDLKKKITCPEYIRTAIREVIRAKEFDAAAAVQPHNEAEPSDPPESPLVVFINAKSGGRQGPELMARLQELMSEEQVIMAVACGHHD